MATLAEINQTLIRVDENTEDTSRGIGAFVKFLQDNKRKDLEAARESNKVVAPDIGPKVSDTSTAVEKAGGGLLDGVRNVLAGATLAKLAPMLGKTLLKRVLGPAAIALFAEDIVEMLLPDGLDNPELKEALTGGLQGAALGFAIGGPLGAAIGGGIGALMTNEKFKKAVEDLGKTLKEQAIVLYDKIEPTVIRFKNSFVDMFNALGITKEGVVEGLAGALTTIGNAAASGVESLTKLVKGDFEPMDLVKGITTLGAVAALLMPGKFVKFLGLLAGKKGLLGLLTKGAAALGLGSLLGFSKADAPEPGGKPTPKPQPGSVVRSASGKLMLAGADGQATVNKAPPGSKVGDMPKKSVIDNFKKFPKLGAAAKFLRAIPGLSMLMSLGELATMNPLTVDGVAGVLGGLGGGTLGAMIGTLLPGIPGLNTLIGGTVGYFLGDALFKGLAQFLLGKKVDAFPEFMNDLINGKDTKSNKPSVGSDSMRMGRGGPTQISISPSARYSGETIQNNVNRGMSPGAMGGSSIAFSADTNQTINNNSSTNALISSGPAVDLQDQMLASGT